MAFKSAQPLSLQDDTIEYDGTLSAKDRVNWNYYVLYYAIPPPGDTCTPESYTDDQTYNNLMTKTFYCPHKWIVRKYLLLEERGGADNKIKIEPAANRFYLTTNEINKYLTATQSTTDVTASETAVDKTNPNSVKVISSNTLVFAVNFFDPFYSAARGDSTLVSPQVQFTVKCFKVLEFGSSGLIGNANLNALSNARTAVQADQKIIPANTNYELK
jgi:hypothetical protein